jgi:hypothetical protein
MNSWDKLFVRGLCLCQAVETADRIRVGCDIIYRADSLLRTVLMADMNGRVIFVVTYRRR